MFRIERLDGARCQDFPRVSGDVPRDYVSVNIINKFSPRERGCSASAKTFHTTLFIFPA